MVHPESGQIKQVAFTGSCHCFYLSTCSGKPCDNLKTVFNGKYEIIPYNKFGARAIYSCDAGYVLAGTRYRKCQGDGYWSGTAPTCETQGTMTSLLGQIHI